MSRGKVTSLDKLIGQRLKAARIMAGKSQTALGAAVGVSFQQVQKLEQGVNRMNVAALLRSCDFLNIAPGEFMRDLQEGGGTIATDNLSSASLRLAKFVNGLPEDHQGIVETAAKSFGRALGAHAA